MATREPIYSRVERVETKVAAVDAKVDRVDDKVDRVTEKVDHVVERVDSFHLNGSGPAIHKLADAADELVTLAKYAPEIAELARQRHDTAVTWRTIQGWIRWNRGTRAIVQTLMTVVMSALFGILLSHWLHLWQAVPAAH